MLLSILIPNYGFNDSVVRCLNSLETKIDNDQFDYEILICDQSCPSDKDLLLNALETHKKIKVINLDKPNVLEARKLLLQHAVGDYIFFIDSDDYIDDGFINKIANSIFEHNYPDLIFTSYYKDSTAKCEINNDLSFIDESNYLKYFYCTDSLNTLWRKIFKKELFKIEEISDLNSINGDDWIISSTIIKNAKTIIFDSSLCGYHYCINESGLTHTMTFERFIKSFILKDDFVLSSQLFDGNLIFNSKRVKFFGFCSILLHAGRKKKEIKEAFIFVRENLLKKLGIQKKMISGSKNKIFYTLLKMKLFSLFYIALKMKATNKR